MLPLVLLAPFLASTLANPLPAASPEPDAQPEPFAILPPIGQDPTSGGHSISLAHTPSSIHRARHVERAIFDNLDPSFVANSPRTRELAERDAVDPIWLLKEEAKNDVRYNDGLGNFVSLIALKLKQRDGDSGLEKRAGEATLTNHNLDASYSAKVQIGSPSQEFDVVLDTGSSDLWVAGSSSAVTTGKYTPGDSTTYLGLNNSFSIQYGSGTAAGTLVQDTVSLAGYSVASQTFASCNEVSSGLIAQSLSGIMGLSWPALAFSQATPWWVTLAKSTAWSSPVFTFSMKRYRNVAGANTIEPDGGKATFGYIDSSLYTGSITYVPISDNAQYWEIPMQELTIQNTNINLGSSTTVAVDTGTTLIGGPESIVQSIYAAIPGSQRMTGAYANYYQYPCSTDINLQLTFGGYTIRVANADFNLGRYSTDTTMCTGAIYIQSLSSSSPVQWIVGDTALKNVYSIYRYSPAAVGFAALPGSSSGAASTSASGSTTIPQVSTLPMAVSTLGNANATRATPSASSSSSGSGSVSRVSSSVSIAQASVIQVTAFSTIVVGSPSASPTSPSRSSGAEMGRSVPGLLATVGSLLLLIVAAIA